MKALVVDDSGVMRKIVAGALSKVGASEVLQAEDGVQAVQAVADNPDLGLIMLDWNMPNKNGLEALQEIRASGNKVPVIMVTTEAEKSRVVEAIKAGANNYIVKPFTPDVIAEKVKAVVSI
jgi:two-component system chemotaxis response regulator CheY